MQNLKLDEKTKLELKFDPKTIKHLGVQMYQTLPPVLAELISNSYDANASWVKIKFTDIDGRKQIVVVDNGDGMSFSEIRDNFLVIGKNRREDELKESRNKRKVTGRKGLGKLAVFGIANLMQVQTIKEGLLNAFNMDLDVILNAGTGTYQPEIINEDIPTDKHSGTLITLRDIKRRTPFNLTDLRESISKRFAFTDEFTIYLEEEGKEPLSINSDTKWEYMAPLEEWQFPEDDNDEFAIKHNITGKIITTKNQLKEDERGVSLFARGKLVNPHEFYDIKIATSYAYNYITGVFYIDYIDDFEEDYISTNRDGLTWAHDELQELRTWLRTKLKLAERRWRESRIKDKEETIQEITGVNLAEWTNTMPEKYKISIKKIVENIVESEEIDKEITNKIVNEINKVVPIYPMFHWRELHSEIQNASEEYYKRQDYYNAFSEAMKRYKNAVKTKSKVTANNDMPIMSSSFGADNKPLSVTAKYKYRPNGEEFASETLDNIEEGQKFLSMGVVAGGRNVLNHEVHKDLRATDLFSEKDCLDLLSLLSHLFERLDDA